MQSSQEMHSAINLSRRALANIEGSLADAKSDKIEFEAKFESKKESLEKCRAHEDLLCKAIQDKHDGLDLELKKNIKRMEQELQEKKDEEIEAHNRRSNSVHKKAIIEYDEACKIAMEKINVYDGQDVAAREAKESLSKKEKDLQDCLLEANQRDFFGGGINTILPNACAGAKINIEDLCTVLEEGLVDHEHMLSEHKECEDFMSNHADGFPHKKISFIIMKMTRTDTERMFCALKNIAYDCNPQIMNLFPEVNNVANSLMCKKKKDELVMQARVRLMKFFIPPSETLPKWALGQKFDDEIKHASENAFGTAARQCAS